MQILIFFVEKKKRNFSSLIANIKFQELSEAIFSPIIFFLRSCRLILVILFATDDENFLFSNSQQQQKWRCNKKKGKN